MQTKPTLAEWRIANPGKSINEYYVEHGPPSHFSIPAQHFAPAQPQPVYVERPSTNSVGLFGLLASGVAAMAFFTPWVSVTGGIVRTLGSHSISPAGFPRFFANLVSQSEAQNASMQFTFFTPWLMLILPCLSLLGVFTKTITIRVISGYIYVAIAAYWLYNMSHISEIINGYGIHAGRFLLGFHAQIEAGYYIGVVGTILMLLDAIQAPWMER